MKKELKSLGIGTQKSTGTLVKPKKFNKDLGYDELYEIEISLVVNEFKCEYAGCGSHQMEITAIADLKELQRLYDSLKKIKNIKL